MAGAPFLPTTLKSLSGRQKGPHISMLKPDSNTWNAFAQMRQAAGAGLVSVGAALSRSRMGP